MKHGGKRKWAGRKPGRQRALVAALILRLSGFLKNFLFLVDCVLHNQTMSVSFTHR